MDLNDFMLKGLEFTPGIPVAEAIVSAASILYFSAVSKTSRSLNLAQDNYAILEKRSEINHPDTPKRRKYSEKRIPTNSNETKRNHYARRMMHCNKIHPVITE